MSQTITFAAFVVLLLPFLLIVAGLLAAGAIKLTYWIEEKRKTRDAQSRFQHHQREFKA